MSNDVFQLGFDDKQVKRRLQALANKSPEAFEKAMEIGGLQFLTWIVNGSERESRKPPILKGFLRGSGSVFVGSKMVGLAPGKNRDAARSHSAPKLDTTWVFNSAYATAMHEDNYNPGPVSTQDGDAGNKYIEKHLKSDRDAFVELVALEIKKELRL